ncbi:tetratricopeptide repeat protein 33 [Impatiens glandulifera]|uniref:tetratricopeptide repeat protein 33 n=1 Tax=Impatiens glandulifera TaxID=253017 RepID=UPI001FB07357|nr:tetratricopeptide repeat protein 33 [Impatiens glandulifera]
MKLTWKEQSKNTKKRSVAAISGSKNLPFDHHDSSKCDDDKNVKRTKDVEGDIGTTAEFRSDEDVPTGTLASQDEETIKLAGSFQAQGEKFAEDGKFREALGKWEAALNLTPLKAVLHEQKAQVLLEIGDAWNAIKAASRATELEPSWAEAWITLGRAQLNFGEPDNAIQSFDRALTFKPDSLDATDDRKTAYQLVKKRKQLHETGLTADKNRYVVGNKPEIL